MEKTLEIGGRAVRLRVTARLPFEYRERFGADLMDDMLRVVSSSAGSDTMVILERFVYLAAKNGGDPEAAAVGNDLPDFLDSLDGVYAIYDAIPDILALWREETGATIQAKKNDAQP